MTDSNGTTHSKTSCSEPSAPKSSSSGSLGSEPLLDGASTLSPDRWWQSLPRSRWFWLGCVLLVIASALHSADRSIGGGDTWVAMSCGRYTSETWDPAVQDQPHRTWQMRLLDLFGIHVTKHDFMGAKTRRWDADQDPSLGEYGDSNFGWVNQNWLTHVLFYKLKQIGTDDPIAENPFGENLIVVYKFLQAIATALLAYWAARAFGAHPVTAAAAVSFGILLSRSFIDLRPNVSTILYATAMILVLAEWTRGRYRAMWWMIPIMIIWGNIHGGFLYAIMIMGLAVVCHAAQHLLRRYAYPLFLLGICIGIGLTAAGVAGLGAELEVVKEASGLAGSIRSWRIAGTFTIVGLVWLLLLGLVRWPAIDNDSFVQVERRGLWYLLGGFAAAVFVPVIFSPFGAENVIHPLVVAALSDEGERWREVVEWMPIWNPRGFGNAGPYIGFLKILAVVMFVWGSFFFLKPRPQAPSTLRKQKPRKRDRGVRDRQATGAVPWPKLDISQFAIMAITIIMSIKSRRFIFLGGVILAPYLAKMAQELVTMGWVLWRRYVVPRSRWLAGLVRAWGVEAGDVEAGGPTAILAPRLPAGLAWPLALAALLATIPVATLFGFSMWDTYYKPALDGRDLTVFRRMVGIKDQPVRLMEFFRENEIEGIVFNEWTNGGFVVFHQRPLPSGEPPCKVFMDGRSQAAYSLAHFLKHQKMEGIESFYRRREDIFEIGRLQETLEMVAGQFGASLDSLALYDALREQVALYKQRADQLPDSEEAEKMLDRSRAFETLISASLTNPELMHKVLVREGVTAVLLDERRSPGMLSMLLQSRDWTLAYMDSRYMLLLRQDAEVNRPFFEKAEQDALHWPDESFTKPYTLGYRMCASGDPATQRAGAQLLMTIGPDEFAPPLYESLLQVAVRQRLYEPVWRFLTGHYEVLTERIDSGQRFGRINDLNAVLTILQTMKRLAAHSTEPEAAADLNKDIKHYRALQRETYKQAREGLF